MPKGAALVTGASSGIGLELARLCAADGYRPILVARRGAELQEVSASLSREHGVNGSVIAVDLADPGAPAAIFRQLEGDTPEILINNAGFGVRGAFAETEWAVETRMVQVNITAAAHLVKLLLPAMLRRGSGRILNVASTAAFVPGPFMAVYYASKAFLLSFSHALANEVQGTGVTVTALCPGPTRTEFGHVAGMEGTSLFNGPVMDPAEVAREGYRAMMAGKAEIIAGARNRRMILATRLAPRSLLASITRRLNSPAT